MRSSAWENAVSFIAQDAVDHLEVRGGVQLNPKIVPSISSQKPNLLKGVRVILRSHLLYREDDKQQKPRTGLG